MPIATVNPANGETLRTFDALDEQETGRRLAAAHSAAIVATGPGDVTVTGNPSCTVKMMGSGRVSCGR